MFVNAGNKVDKNNTIHLNNNQSIKHLFAKNLPCDKLVTDSSNVTFSHIKNMNIINNIHNFDVSPISPIKELSNESN